MTGGQETVALRVPRHPLALEVLGELGGGLAAPSANRFGKVSPTTADHVRADLGDLVDYVLDGGPCPIGVESTIVDCTVEPAQVLRPGGIPTEDIAALRTRMEAAAAAMDFEEARRLRDRINLLFEDPETERTRLVLASYHSGLTRVLDAFSENAKINNAGCDIFCLAKRID